MNEQLLIETDSLVLRQFVLGDTHKLLIMSQEIGLPDQVYRDV